MHCRGAHGGVCRAGGTMKLQPTDVELCDRHVIVTLSW